MATSITSLFGFMLFIFVLYQWFELSYRGVIIANGVYLVIKFVMNLTLLRYCNEVREYDDCYFFSKETISGLLPMFQKGLAGMTAGAL